MGTTLGSALFAVAVVLAPAASAVVTLDWVTVDAPGNSCEMQSFGCLGQVYAAYEIGAFEVTNAQYAEFLNAVAQTDTHALYNVEMGTAGPPSFGGIARSGVSGSFGYSALAGREDKPVNFVSFFDGLRFANWLHNGQPTGAQDATTTEDGSYEILPGNQGYSVIRNPGAAVVVPSVHEWYKAAFYDTGSMGYFEYPAGSDAETTCATHSAASNTANCASAVGDFTDVGSYAGAASPNGTFDQGGNVYEWTDTILFSEIVGFRRVVRGGDLFSQPFSLAAAAQSSEDPFNEHFLLGFRVARRDAISPVPSLSALETALLSSLLGLAGRRSLRRRG